MRLNNSVQQLLRCGIEKIIFDMDGVITSEYMYWDAAALTVYELLFSKYYYGNSDIDVLWCIDNISYIRDVVFCDDKTVLAVKSLGVNTNWDLALVVFCVSKALNPKLEAIDSGHFKQVCSYIENLMINAPELYDKIYCLAAEAMNKNEAFFKREQSDFWTGLQISFGHWFLGTEQYMELYGIPPLARKRKGLKSLEKPIVELEKLHSTLSFLKNRGIKLGVGTGRPNTELDYPIKLWDIEKYFDAKSCATYTDIVNAEKSNNYGISLAKPHPFVFLKAAAAGKYTDKQLIDGEYDKRISEKVLVVGDAPADLIAAKQGGFLFAAVLTGVSGKKMRSYFEENEADIILDNVLEFEQDI